MAYKSQPSQSLNNDQLEGKPFSQAVQYKKESLYDKLPFTLRQVNCIIYVSVGALVIVFILIVLEALGIFAIG